MNLATSQEQKFSKENQGILDLLKLQEDQQLELRALSERRADEIEALKNKISRQTLDGSLLPERRIQDLSSLDGSEGENESESDYSDVPPPEQNDLGVSIIIEDLYDRVLEDVDDDTVLSLWKDIQTYYPLTKSGIEKESIKAEKLLEKAPYLQDLFDKSEIIWSKKDVLFKINAERDDREALWIKFLIEIGTLLQSNENNFRDFDLDHINYLKRYLDDGDESDTNSDDSADSLPRLGDDPNQIIEFDTFISAPGWSGAKDNNPLGLSFPEDFFQQPSTYGYNMKAKLNVGSNSQWYTVPDKDLVYAVNGNYYFTLRKGLIPAPRPFLLPISPYIENGQQWGLQRYPPKAQGMIDITSTLFFRQDVAEVSITERQDGTVIMQVKGGNMGKYNMNVSKTFEVVPHTGMETPLRVQLPDPVTENISFEITSAEVNPDHYENDPYGDEKYFLVPAKEGDDNNATLTLLSTVLESRTTAAIGPESNPSSDQNLESICNMATSEEYCNFPCKYNMVNSSCNAMGQDSIYDYIINKADPPNKRLNKKMLRELIEVALDNGLLSIIDKEKKEKVEMATRALYDHIKVGIELENLGENDVFTSLMSRTRRIESMLIAIAKALNSRKNSTARTLASKKLTYDTVTAVFGGALASVLLSLVADYYSNGQNFNGLCDYRGNPGDINLAKLPYSGSGGKFFLDRLEWLTGDFCPGTTGGDDNYKINIYGGRENSVSVTGTNDNIRFDIKFERAPYGDDRNRGINVKEFQVDDFPREYETIFKFISETLNQEEEFLYQVHLGIIRSASNNDFGFILSNRDSDDILRQIINDALYETFTKAYFSGSVVHPDGLYSATLRKGSDETPWGFFVDFTFKRENEGLYEESISLIDLYKKVDFENESASNYYDKFDATDLVGEMFDNMVEAKDSGNEEKISVKDWKYHDPAEPWFIKNDEEIDFTLSGNNTATPRPVSLDIRVYGENVEIYYEYVKGSIGSGVLTFGGDTIQHYIILTQSELFKKAQAVFPGNFENNYDAVAGAGIIKEFFKKFVFSEYPEVETYHGSFHCYFYPQDCPEPQDV
ncbi:MAG: hypothetical protein CL678_14005 [Bdellovibrionaceae bacterium]|nr:hypothetical protein [Pseudobdellovibrionaceae bacterium]